MPGESCVPKSKKEGRQKKKKKGSQFIRRGVWKLGIGRLDVKLNFREEEMKRGGKRREWGHLQERGKLL